MRDNRLLANDESRSPQLDQAPTKHWLYRGMSRIRFDHVLRQSVLGCVIMPMKRLCKRSRLFFGNVNQVLVRLWARVMEICPSGWVDIPLFSRLV
jgi:hypothetical protein